jgi:hypothetical protein
MAATAEALMNSLAGGGDGASDSQALDTSRPDGDGGGPPNDAGGGGGDAGSGAPAGSVGSGGVGSEGDATATDPAAAAKPTAEQLYQQSMAANREVRSENKALKAQLQELTAKIEALAKPPAPAAEQPEEPDFLADPKGYVDAAKAKLKELTDKIEADKQQQTEAQKQQQEAQETWTKVLTAEQEFAATTPDYHDALNHVRAIRAEQIKIEIRETEDREPTAEEIGKILNIQEARGAAALIAKGKNPSKFYYEYAKTFGYKPKAADPPAAVTNTPKPDKEAVRTMGSGGAGDSVSDEPASDSPLGGLLAAAQSEHRAQFKKKRA